MSSDADHEVEEAAERAGAKVDRLDGWADDLGAHISHARDRLEDMRRTLDESLAHEFAHYLQVTYFAADLADETCEHEAIAVQIAFRDARDLAPGERS